MAPIAIDVYSGCGGSTIGLKEAGFEVPHAFDCDKEQVLIYNNNLGRSSTCHHAENMVSAIPAVLKRKARVDLLWCSPYTKESAYDDVCLVDILSHLHPTIFVFECPPSFLSDPHFATMSTNVRKTFNSILFDLNASLVRLPQSRIRTFWVGGRKDAIRPGILDEMYKKLTATLTEVPFGVCDAFESVGVKCDFDHYFMFPDNELERGIFPVILPSPELTMNCGNLKQKHYSARVADSTTIENCSTLTIKQLGILHSFPQQFKFQTSNTLVGRSLACTTPPIVAETIGKLVLPMLASATPTPLTRHGSYTMKNIKQWHLIANNLSQRKSRIDIILRIDAKQDKMKAHANAKKLGAKLLFRDDNLRELLYVFGTSKKGDKAFSTDESCDAGTTIRIRDRKNRRSRYDDTFYSI
jgi:DNA (cytosine-5)-methyltransferase 1